MDLPNMGVKPTLCEAIASFNGASKIGEKLPKVELKWLTRTFAHSPVKLRPSGKGTIPDRTLVACLDTHV
jgi:hypothetical protein